MTTNRLALRVSATFSLLLFSVAAPAFGQRHAPDSIPVPTDFQEAIANGTRTTNGAPGAQYWQQRADYIIEASLDVETARVTATESVTYTNNSPNALPTVLFHLDQNVFAPGARRNRRAPITGGMPIEAIRINGSAIEVPEPGRGYYSALTLMDVPLPEPLATGESVVIEFDWSFTVPPAPTFRNGNLDFEVFAVAQWYPRVAVYDDVYGWDRTPYLGDGEFYLEYGDFDVTLTVPAGWLVGGTGLLQNPGEILKPESLQRLGSVMALVEGADGIRADAGGVESAEMNHVVHVVDGSPETGTLGGGPLSWRFVANDVRDFAWATSNAYRWDATAAEIPGSGAVAVGQALYRPQFEAWEEVARYAAHTLVTYSEWLGSYPYPQLTITEGPVGGMEYPMMVFNPSSNNPRGVAGVTIHEGGHQWFPMLVGSMEAKHAWMDEGFNSYFDELSAAALWGEEVEPWGDNRQYQGSAGTDREVPLMRHTDLVNPYGERTLAAYRKPAVVLGALREVIGDEAFFGAFQDYVVEWSYKHPQPTDFFNTVERHVGEDLDWFWRPLVYETAVLDHGITGVLFADGTTTITLSDQGGVFLPTHVRVTKEDGSVADLVVSVDEWLSGKVLHELTVDGRVTRVELDPDHRFPDVDRSNDVWSR